MATSMGQRSRSVRPRGGQVDILPGVPDSTPSTPPKALEYQALTLDEAIARAHQILDRALAGVTVEADQVLTGLPKNIDALLQHPRRSAYRAELTFTTGEIRPLPVGTTAVADLRFRFTGAQVLLDSGAGESVRVNDETVVGPVVLQPRDSVQVGGETATVTYWRTLDAPDEAFTLFSGGGDSSILAHLMREHGYPMVHVRTGISIPATWTYVQAVAKAWGLPLHAASSDDTYEDLVLGRVRARTGPNKGKVVWKGFPGPAAHYLMYQRLKERALEKLRSKVISQYQTKTGEPRQKGRPGQILFLGGMRWAESDRRFINAEEYDPWGSVLWVSPIVWWTNGHMREYRARYMCQENHEHAEHRLCHGGALPLSIVTEHLHMSGDCLCGAFARPGELDEIGMFWPDVAAQLRCLQDEARDAGLDRCIWGEGKRPAEKVGPRLGKLCSKCVPDPRQMDITDDWLAQGLIDPTTHAKLASRPAA